MNEIENLKKFDVFKTKPLSSVPTGTKIFSIVTGCLTKRTKAGTPEHEEVDKRKCRMCLRGHKVIEGDHYNRIDAYAPVPTWSTIKLQLALTSRHHLQLTPYLKYYGSQPSMDSFYVFGSYCSVHMGDDHVDNTNKNVTASPGVYLCNAGHFKSKGHVVSQELQAPSKIDRA